MLVVVNVNIRIEIELRDSARSQRNRYIILLHENARRSSPRGFSGHLEVFEGRVSRMQGGFQESPEGEGRNEQGQASLWGQSARSDVFIGNAVGFVDLCVAFFFKKNNGVPLVRHVNVTMENDFTCFMLFRLFYSIKFRRVYLFNFIP